MRNEGMASKCHYRELKWGLLHMKGSMAAVPTKRQVGLPTTATFCRQEASREAHPASFSNPTP